MISSLFVCIALFSPYVLSSVENCTATKCLHCSANVTPNCTLSQIDQWLYNVYCEPPITPECTDINVTNAYCVALADIDNNNGLWIYRGLKFSFSKKHTNCSIVFNGRPVTPNCLHLYSEVTSVDDVGHSIFCSCYENDCQKRINITFKVIERNSGTPSSSPFSPTSVDETPSPTTTFASVYEIPSLTTTFASVYEIPSLTTTFASVYEIPSLTTTFASVDETLSPTSSSITSDDRTSLILPTLSSLSTVGVHSVTPTILPTSGPHTLTDTLIVVISALAVISFLAIALLVVISFCYFRKNFFKRKRHSHQIHLHATPPIIEVVERSEEPPLPFQLLQTIGRGKFGSVWKALYNDETVAIKIFTPHHRLSWQNEKYIHSLDSTPHENILRFIGSEIRGSGYNVQYFTITEYYHLGSLHQFLRHNSLTWEQAWNMMYTVTSGLAHLHSTTYCNSEGFIAEKYAVVHRDVKTANILMKHETGQCVLGDLGLALILDPAADDRQLANSGQVGTFRYMAPEALDARLNLRDIESFKQIDVYALALVLWEICMRCEFDKATPVQPYQPPFFDLVGERPTLDQMKEIVVVAKQRPSLSGSWYAHKNMRVIANIMTESWDEDSEARLTAANIISRLENLEGSKARLKSESNSPVEDACCEFASPNSEMSQISQSSLHKNVRLSASFSGSSSTHPVVPAVRYSVGTVSNADIPNNLIQSVQDLQASYELEPFSSVANLNSRHSSIHPNLVSIPHAQTQNEDESGDLRHLNIDKTTGQAADDNHSVHSDNN